MKAASQKKPVVSPVLIVVAVVASLLVVGGLILLGTQGANTNEPLEVSQFPAKGKADAPVTIVEYSDYG